METAHKFFVRFLLFLVPIIGVIFYVENRLAQIPNDYNTKKSKLELVLDQIEVLVTGPSHAQLAFKTADFNRRSFNLANVSQSLVVDAQLIEKYLDRLTKLKLIILEVSYFSFRFGMDELAYYDLNANYLRVFHVKAEFSWAELFDSRSYSLCFFYGLDQCRSYLTNSTPASRASEMDATGWSPARGNFQEWINHDGAVQRIAWHHSLMHERHVEKNLAAIRRVIDIAKNRNIKVVVVTTPTYQTYRTVEIAEYSKDMRENLAALQTEFQANYYDYESDPRLQILTDYFDNDHLNVDGATRFTSFVNAEILNKELP